MPFENFPPSSNTTRRKTDADDYWVPVPEKEKSEASRAGDVLSQTAWKPPALDTTKGPQDKATPSDKARKPLELSKVYPIGELDKRAQAWMDYAALVHPARNLDIKKPADKPPQTNPYPYEPPYKPPTDYVPPTPPADKPQGADWSQWAVGLAALGAGAFALHKTLKWLRGDKDEPNAKKEQEFKTRDQDLKTKEQELKTEEEKIKQDKEKLDTDTTALKDKEKQLADREEKAKAEETRIAEQEKKAKDFAEREIVLNDKAKLNDEKTLINEEKTKLAEQAKALNETRTTIATRSQDLQTRQEQLLKEQEKLATDQSAYQKSLNGFEKESADLQKLQEDSAKLQHELDEAKVKLGLADEKLAKDKAELATTPDEKKQKAIANEEIRLAVERKQLENQQTKLDEETKKIAEDKLALEQAKKDLETKSTELKTEEGRITAEKDRLTQKAKTIETEKTGTETEKRTIAETQEKLGLEKAGLDRQKAEIVTAKDQLVKEREAASKPPVPETPPEKPPEKPPEEKPTEKPPEEKPPQEKPATTSVDEVQQALKDNQTFNKLTDEARMGDALKQLTDRALQRMPESNADKADFLSKQLKAAMRKQLGVATDAELPESVRNMQVKVVDSEAKAPRMVQGNAGDPAVLEIPAKLLTENPKGVLVDAYTQASGLSMVDLMHANGNKAITVRSIEPMLNKIASQAEKIVGARSIALANQEKPTVSPDTVASDRKIVLDPQKPIVTAWDGENLTFGGEQFHVRTEIEKLEKERDSKVKDMEEQVRKAKELAESTKKASDVEAARTLETQLLAEKQNLRVVTELKAAINGQRGTQAQERARTLVRDAADRAISDRLNAREGASAGLSRGAAIAMVVTTLAFLYVGANRPAKPDDYQSTFTVH